MTNQQKEPEATTAEDKYREGQHSAGFAQPRSSGLADDPPTLETSGQNLLLNEKEAEEYRSDWLEIQTRFVDDPREAVETADELVSDLMDTITSNLAEERASLERQWSRRNEPSTEELRKSLMRYRSYFNRLLKLESSSAERSIDRE